MPRQSFLTTDFFVAATEENALKVLALLPDQNNRIHLVKENSLLQTTRFSYEQKEKALEAFIDVSVLPLNDQYVRFCLHAFYANEKRIEDPSEMENVLCCFKKLLYDALKIDYPVKEKKPGASQSSRNLFRLPASFLSMLRFKEA